MARKNLGDILTESGRITRAEVDRALEHQREHGGYFGQALIALGIVRPEELEWALASQFDLPLIFPDATAVEREVAGLVTAEWALTHLTVPIVRTAERLTVVVESPQETEAIAELRQRTELPVELALASAPQIRELIHALYGEGTAPTSAERLSEVALEKFVGDAVSAGAARFGFSVRGGGAIAWYEPADPTGERATDRPARVRRRLAAGWEKEVAEVMEPDPLERSRSAPGAARWTATLRRGRAEIRMEARSLADAGGVECVFRPLADWSPAGDPQEIPPHIVADLRLLGRSGVRVVVRSRDAALADSLVARLPSLVWADELHAVHLATQETPHAPFALTPQSPSDPILEALEDCRFDVLSVDLPENEYPLEQIFRVSPIVIARLREPDSEGRLEALGIGWILEVGDAGWELRPART